MFGYQPSLFSENIKLKKKKKVYSSFTLGFLEKEIVQLFVETNKLPETPDGSFYYFSKDSLIFHITLQFMPVNKFSVLIEK